MPRSKPVLACLIASALALAGIAPSPAAQRPTTTSVVGDSLSCPRTPAGDISVCGDGIRIVDLLYLHAYAACLTRHHRAEAASAVKAYTARRDREGLRGLVAQDRWCAPAGASRMSAILLAGALAETLPGWRGRLQEGFGDIAESPDLARCLIATDRRAALALLRNAPFSPGETRATGQLVAALPNCVPAGMQIKTYAAALRSMLALALFDPSAAEQDDRAPLLAVTPLQPLRPLTITITITPVAVVGKPRPPLAFIKRINSNHVPPDLPRQYDPEEILAAEAAFPTDADTGETVDPLEGPSNAMFPGQ